MTHKDIYTKFMIEYDKADITSSYPSLTKYEIATILDKAYLALIAQKLTGNNPRQSAFESDNKAIEDVRPLLVSALTDKIIDRGESLASNEIMFEIPDDYLYFIQGSALTNNEVSSTDKTSHTDVNTKLVSHEVAQKFENTANNMPWIVEPVVYIESEAFHLLYDTFQNRVPTKFRVTYIKKPNKFALEDGTADFTDTSIFQLNDSMAEELINLAIAFSTKIVENPRFSTEIQSRPLES